MLLFKFLFAVCGLVMITNKSALLTPLRVWITDQETIANEVIQRLHALVLKARAEAEISEITEKTQTPSDLLIWFAIAMGKVWWFFNSIFNCAMCMSVWAGLILYPVYLFEIDAVMDVLCGVTVVSLLVRIWEKLK